MELHVGDPENYCVKKIKAAAFLSGLRLRVVPSAGNAILLKTSEGTISQHNAILRYLAACNITSGLAGRSEFEFAQICQWMDFLWSDLELCLHVMVGVQSKLPQFAMEAVKEEAIRTRTLSLISTGLRILEDHLTTRTFMVGERTTVADISLICVCMALLKANLCDIAAYPCLLRWARTVGSDLRIQRALGLDPTSLLPPPADVSLVETGGGKWSRGRIRVKELLILDKEAIGRLAVVKGWIRTSRSAQNDQLLFVELNDGSSVKGIQLVLDIGKTRGFDDVLGCGGVGASLSVEGTVVASQGKGQSIEILVKSAKVLGAVFGGENGTIGGKYYPMAGKGLSFEFLREKAHLRARTKVFSATMRVRNAMAFATHKFFNERGFVYTQTPLITAADCEGAGEQFAVTTMLPEEAKAADIPVTKDGKVDFSKDFFGRRYAYIFLCIARCNPPQVLSYGIRATKRRNACMCLGRRLYFRSYLQS